MCNPFRSIASIGIIGIMLASSACAQRSGPQVDPIFNTVPGGRYACANAADTAIHSRAALPAR